jgi:hypothetical protein
MPAGHGFLVLLAEQTDSAKAEQLHKLMAAMRLPLRDRAA